MKNIGRIIGVILMVVGVVLLFVGFSLDNSDSLKRGACFASAAAIFSFGALFNKIFQRSSQPKSIPVTCPHCGSNNDLKFGSICRKCGYSLPVTR